MKSFITTQFNKVAEHKHADLIFAGASFITYCILNHFYPDPL